MKQLPPLEEPLNAQERNLYAIAIRLDAIIELLSPKEIVKEEEVVVEPVKETPKRATKKSTKK